MLHGLVAPVSLLPAIALVAMAPTWGSALAFAIFGITVTAMFTTSGVFHLAEWSDHGWWRMRNLDMNAIAVLIAGEFTGFAGVLLEGRLQFWLLVGVWVAACVAVFVRWLPITPPDGLMTTIFVAMGSLGLVSVDPIRAALGPTGSLLLVGGCLLYLVGALMLGARWPDPWPDTFGYHEIWHVFVTGAIVMHYLCMFLFVVPYVRGATG